jgi:hypothetical protein
MQGEAHKEAEEQAPRMEEQQAGDPSPPCASMQHFILAF